MSKDMYKGPKAYQPEGKAETPYNDLKKEYDTYFGEVRKERDKWRLIAFCAVGGLAVSVLGWFYAISLPKAIPYVIEVAPWGEAKYRGNIAENGNITIPEKAKVYAIRQVVEKVSSIPLDQAVLLKNLDEAYQLLGPRAAAVITQELEKENIYKLFGTIRREVNIESILNVTGAAWQVDWMESDYELLESTLQAKRRMRAIVTISQGTPGESVKTANPLGIVIDTFQRQVLEGASK